MPVAPKIPVWKAIGVDPVNHAVLFAQRPSTVTGEQITIPTISGLAFPLFSNPGTLIAGFAPPF